MKSSEPPHLLVSRLHNEVKTNSRYQNWLRDAKYSSCYSQHQKCAKRCLRRSLKRWSFSEEISRNLENERSSSVAFLFVSNANFRKKAISNISIVRILSCYCSSFDFSLDFVRCSIVSQSPTLRRSSHASLDRNEG
jgi:hypothetical protein